MIYVDTSVLVPYYTPESRSADANAIVRDRKDVCVNDLCVAEFHVTLARKVREKVLSKAAAKKAIDLFDEHFGEDCGRRVPLSRRHIERVKSVASKTEIVVRTLDALHLAVAEDLGAALATFDTRLADAAKSHGTKVIC